MLWDDGLFKIMALIAMCCHDTEDNGRTEYTRRTLESLMFTVDWSKHRLVIIDNNSCEATKQLIKNWKLPEWIVITLSENIGTARAVNRGIKLRNNGESVCKLDNDVVIHIADWLDELEEVVARDKSYGIVGLKRKDLRQTPYDADPNFRSELIQIPHELGQRWIVVEVTSDIMGTCTLLSSDLLDKLGGYAQPLVYAFDDTLMNLRAGLAGFKKCFLPHIDLDHIDTGSNPYSQEKIKIANDAWPIYHEWHEAYINGKRPLFEEI